MWSVVVIIIHGCMNILIKLNLLASYNDENASMQITHVDECLYLFFKSQMSQS